MNKSRLFLTLHRAAITLTILIVAGCSSSNIQDSGTTETKETIQLPRLDASQLAGTTWQAKSILGKAAGATDSTLSFNKDGISGNAGCNQFQATAELGRGTLQVGPVATTRMMCEPSVSGQEIVFLEALELSRGWEWTGDTLELLDEANAVVLRFQQP